MTGKSLRVAIIGCGVIGTVHAGAIRQHPSLSVGALVDMDGNAARKLADRVEGEGGSPRPPQFSTLAEALADADFEIVAVCTPSGLHALDAIRALEAGKHVLVEKPLDVDVARGRELLKAAIAGQKRGLVSSVVSQHRFDPEATTVRAAVRAGSLGRLSSAVASVAWWRSQEYYESGTWRGTWELDGGGALMNQSVHTVDLLLWMMGRPVEVFAMTGLIAHEGIEVEDTAVAVVKFSSGALATLHATTAAYPNVTNRLQIHGDRGSAVIDDSGLHYFHVRDPGDSRPLSFMGLPFGEGNQAGQMLPPESTPRAAAFDLVPGHLRQYEDFYEAVEHGAEVGVPIEGGLLALATVRAVYLSATSNEPVRIDDVIAGDYDEIVVRTG